MKIAIVASPYLPVPPPKYGGIELVIHHLIKGLLEQGHEPILLAPGDSIVDCELIPIVEKHLKFPKSKTGLPEFERAVKAANKNTERLLRKVMKRVDVIHSHGHSNGIDLRKFRDFPNVTTIHNPIIFEDLDYYRERQELNFISISKNQQESFPDLKYVGVVYNGENPDEFPFVEKPDDYVCFLGRMDREKSPHMAIQLAINLGMEIKLGGNIDYHGRDFLEESVKPLLDHPLVEYLGELGFEEKVKLLSHAKCNLHPTSFREPFGLDVLEAAYCGTPTLAVDRGSMPELIEEDRTGMLVEDFVEGYHQIEACFRMDRSYISTRARQLFNYQNMTKHYVDAYRRVINNSVEEKDPMRGRWLPAPQARKKLADAWAASWHQLW